MAHDSSFLELLRQVRAGDERAAELLVYRYEAAIRREIRFRMVDRQMRQVLDSTDVCQSVLASFFVRAASGQFELNDPQDLLRLLLRMARNKVADQSRRLQADRRDSRRNLPLETIPHYQSALADPTPNPSEQASLKELLSEFRSRLSREESRVANLRAKGYTWDTIAEELNSPPEALRKRLSRAIDRISAELNLIG